MGGCESLARWMGGKSQRVGTPVRWLSHVKGCGLLVERMMSWLKYLKSRLERGRGSPEFAGVPSRAPARRRCVRVRPKGATV